MFTLFFKGRMDCLNKFRYIHTMKYSEAFEKDGNRKRCPRYSFVSKEITNFVFKRKKKDIFACVYRPRMVFRNI